jgi:peroxiredoxin
MSKVAWIVAACCGLSADAVAQETPAAPAVPAVAAQAAKEPATRESLEASMQLLALEPDAEAAKRAIDAIAGSGADPKLLVALVQTAARSKPNLSTEALFQALVDRVENRDVQGWACYSLSRVLRDYAADVAYWNDPKTAPAAREAYAQRRGAQLMAANVARGAPALKEASLVALRRVVDDFFFADHRKAGYLGAVAEAELYELEHLQVGMVAPEIAGSDEDDVAFKLSDYRGKVVLVDFWGYWCPICVRNIPDERELVARTHDRPFALVGINSDPKERLQVGMRYEPLPWRSFWDGGDAYGPIATRWNVGEWPMLYVLDEHGVIQWKGEPIDEAIAKIDELLAKAPAAPAATGSAPAAVEGRGTR